MNRANDIVKTALNYATSVLFDLDDAQVAVHRVVIDGGMPLITVDRAPPTGRPVHSITRTVDGERVTFHMVDIRGCRVQWRSRDAVRRTAA